MLETMATIDWAGARKRLGGNEALLRALIGSLLENAGGLLASSRSFLAAGDARQAARLLHGLRGSSVNVGWTSLAELAGDAEKAIATRDENRTSQLLQSIEQEIAGFSTGAGLAGEPEEDVPAGLPDEKNLVALRANLAAGNMAALDLFSSLKPALKASMAADQWANLAAAMSRLDFQAASAALGSLNKVS
ncbi:Hpt domain-containing protein [Radicibacter daui]|uniref:Hpt domain-containing protein n=1 Tax=Radicibacter daui TaxID=3064829 RepID=UPI0040469B5B